MMRLQKEHRKYLGFLMGAFLMLLLCLLPQQVQAAQQTCTISSCKIQSSGKKVVVKAKVTKKTKAMGKKLYLIAYDSYEKIGTTTKKKPIASVRAKKGTVTFKANLNAGKTNSRLFSKFAVAYKKGKKYRIISTEKYITNPQVLASYRGSYPKTYSKKGLQAEDPADSIALGTQHTVLNWTINSLLQEGGEGYRYKGKTYYFNYQLLNYYDELIHNYNQSGSKVTVILLLQNAPRKDLNAMMYRGSGANYSGIKLSTKTGCRTFEALMSYLAQRYGQKKHLVSGWILGNEIGNTKEWNYGGGASLNSYIDNYAKAFRICNTAVRSVNKNAHVYVSLDYHWNYDPDGEGKAYFTSKSVLDAFNSSMKSKGRVDWYIAYHAYPQGLLQPEFWDDTMATETEDSQIINFKNLHVLTNYVRKHYGSKVKIMLSEQSFTVNKGEQMQAAAYAYAYYKAEADSMVEAFIYGRHMDNAGELSPGGSMIQWGLRTQTGARRLVWHIFQYIDTPDSLRMTKSLLPSVDGVSSWNKVWSSASKKLAKMPAKRKKVTGFGVQQSTSDSVTLSWNANPAAGGYRLYRATSEKGTYKLLKNITGNAQTTYTDTKRTLGKTYYYKIRMYVDVPGGSRLYGGWAYTKGQTSLETTTMTGALGKAGAVQVSWKKLAKADGYALYRSQNAQKGYTLAAELKGANTLEYTDTGLTAGTVWYYKVAPYVTVSGKKYYAAYTEPVSATVLPVQTSIASLTPGGGRMLVTWNAVPDASGYEVYAAYAKDGFYSKQFETTDRTVCSFMHTPKYAKREYFYKVRAFVLVNGQRLYADFSAPYSAISYKNDVILTSAVWDADAPVLGWKTNTAAAGYQLARSTAEDGEYVTLDADIPASGENSCTYTDTQATGEVLYYRIRLYEKNSDGVVIYGEWSEPYRVTKQTITPEETEREPQAMPRTQQEEPGVKQPDPEANVTEQPAAEDEDVTEQPVTEEENVTEQSVTVEEDITGKTETA